MKQVAFGQPQIHTDTIIFRWKDEIFEFPCLTLIPQYAKYNGYFYEAKVSDLKKLKKRAKHG